MVTSVLRMGWSYVIPYPYLYHEIARIAMNMAQTLMQRSYEPYLENSPNAPIVTHYIIHDHGSLALCQCKGDSNLRICPSFFRSKYKLVARGRVNRQSLANEAPQAMVSVNRILVPRSP